ncbi:MAG: hypothetical protein ACFBSF_12710 [Leptolyngbyaceae cyanobacterium]
MLDGRYVPIEPNEQGHLWSEQLGLYLGTDNNRPRFFNDEGQLIPYQQRHRNGGFSAHH